LSDKRLCFFESGNARSRKRVGWDEAS